MFVAFQKNIGVENFEIFYGFENFRNKSIIDEKEKFSSFIIPKIMV